MIHASLERELIDLRRTLHQNPEVGFELPMTSQFVQEKLRSYGIHSIQQVGVYSIVAVIENGEGPTIGLRADMDALPMQELNTHEYCSKVPNKMHACGHDAHTAMLLTAAKVLVQDKSKWSGRVKLIFQEAEEGPDPGGAYGVIQSKAVDDVDCFFGLHVSPLHESGKIAARENEAMASADTVKIRIEGKGTHAAFPHLGVDLSLLQAHLILAFQEIVSRRISPVEPAVITIAKVSLGSAHNIIADHVELEGTVRTFSFEMRDFIEQEMRHVIQTLANTYHATAHFEYIRTYDPTINTPQVVQFIRTMMKSTLGETAFQEIPKPSMGAEDFSRYIHFRKGAIAWLGTRNSKNTGYALHHPKFDLDESALKVGVHALTQFVIQYPKEDFK